MTFTLPQPPESPNIRVIAQYLSVNGGGGGGGGSTAWADITDKPNTLSGFGITDAYTKAASDGRYVMATDVYTKTAADGRFQPIGTYQTPQTSLAGYGITDAYTKTASDSRYLLLSGGTVTGNLNVTGQIDADTAFVTNGLACGSLSIGGNPPAVVRTGSATSVPSDLTLGQIYFGY